MLRLAHVCLRALEQSEQASSIGQDDHNGDKHDWGQFHSISFSAFGKHYKLEGRVLGLEALCMLALKVHIIQEKNLQRMIYSC